jgi:hypothetical protein
MKVPSRLWVELFKVLHTEKILRFINIMEMEKTKEGLFCFLRMKWERIKIFKLTFYGNGD